MPIYEYECESCQYRFEKWFPSDVNSKLTDKCPHCEQGKVNKLISAANFNLVGSGFYVNDYKRKT